MIPEVSLSLAPVPVTPYHLDAVNVSLGDQTSERLGGEIPSAMLCVKGVERHRALSFQPYGSGPGLL